MSKYETMGMRALVGCSCGRTGADDEGAPKYAPLLIIGAALAGTVAAGALVLGRVLYMEQGRQPRLAR